ncbi:medium-chain dehydrogenase/reductase like protein [Agrocybe pediades]|nr:medium-chain dehydrogenase/reductase like protein [Agrocybe pediades]
MTYIRCEAYRLHETWEYVVDEIPVPTPGKGQILVKVKAAALNPADWKVRKLQAKILFETFPAILGSDIAGDVEAVGEGVDDFKVGDRVFYVAENWKDKGGYQQYAIANHELVAKIPHNVSYDEVATLPLALATAYSGLYAAFPHGIGLTPPAVAEGYGKYSGNGILVLGGASTVGQAVLQFARLSGFSPIITTASLKNTAALKKLGATHVISRDLSTEEVLAEISKITPKPVEYTFDAVIYESTQQLAVGVVAHAPNGGTAAIATYRINVKVPSDKVKVAKVFGGVTPFNYELFKTLYHDTLHGWVEKGLIIPNRVEVLPGGLSGIDNGLKRLEADEVSRLKLVVRPHERA